MDTIEYQHDFERVRHGELLRCITRRYRTELGDLVVVHSFFRDGRLATERVTVSGPGEDQLKRVSRRGHGGRNWPTGER